MSFTPEQRAKGLAKICSKESLDKREVIIYRKRFRNAYKNLIKLGMTLRDIDLLFGADSHGGLKKSRDRHPDLQKAHMEAMETLEAQLAGKMIVQALGYDYDELKTQYAKVDGKWKAVKKERFKKHQPGNSSLFIFLMSNRFPDDWKVSKELITKQEGYDSEPSERARKQIESLARGVLENSPERPDRKRQIQG